jgi:integrase/recombinase XerC
MAGEQALPRNNRIRVRLRAKLTRAEWERLRPALEMALVEDASHSRHISIRTVQLMVKRLARAAGLPEWDRERRYTPHKLRHRYASDVLKKSRNIRVVQELLGHANLATTEIYTHVEDDTRKRRSASCSWVGRRASRRSSWRLASIERS